MFPKKMFSALFCGSFFSCTLILCFAPQQLLDNDELTSKFLFSCCFHHYYCCHFLGKILFLLNPGWLIISFQGSVLFYLISLLRRFLLLIFLLLFRSQAEGNSLKHFSNSSGLLDRVYLWERFIWLTKSQC